MKKVENYMRDEKKFRGFQDPIRVTVTLPGRLHSLAKKAVEEDSDIDRVSELMRKALVNELDRRGHKHETPFVLRLRARNVARDEILEAMNNSAVPMNTHELAKHLECNKRTMHAVLYELQQSNMVIKMYRRKVMISYYKREKKGGKLTGRIIKVNRPKDMAYWVLHPNTYPNRRLKESYRGQRKEHS